MSEKLKRKILEFVSITKECPDNLQEKCFELLLSDHLKQSHHSTQNDDGDKKKDVDINTEDIMEKDLHVKAKQFLKNTGVTIDNINQLFYKEDGKFLPLYDDIKSTKAVECQIRIALIEALLNGMQSGHFTFDGESVRKETQTRKCYDSANFTRNFNINKSLFDNFEKYKKTESAIKLSSVGKKYLAEVINALQ